jgi:hypothetical protein
VPAATYCTAYAFTATRHRQCSHSSEKLLEAPLPMQSGSLCNIKGKQAVYMQFSSVLLYFVQLATITQATCITLFHFYLHYHLYSGRTWFYVGFEALTAVVMESIF